MKSFFKNFSLLFLAVLFFSPPSYPRAATDADYCQAGNNFYTSQKYDQAIRYYQAAIQVNPNSWQAYQGLGNCYYSKHNNGSAVSNYQKALDLNPDNPQLINFVKVLRAQIAVESTAPENKPSEVDRKRELRIASGITDEHFELSPCLGLALDPGDAGLGIGGGMGAFYMLDPQFGFGGMLHYYAFGSSQTTPSNYFTQSSTTGIETIITNVSVGSLELVAAVKYKFNDEGIIPYLVVGAGLADVIVSTSTSYNYQSGEPLNPSQDNNRPSISNIYPVIDGGGGVEFSLGQDLKFFAEGRLDCILGGFEKETYLPVEIGLNFTL